MLLPMVLSIALGGVYLWRMLHVWPMGKDGWIEAGMVMMVFHLICVSTLLPAVIWAVAHSWSHARLCARIGLIFAGFALLAATVVLPELALKRMERIRPNKSTNQFPSYLGNRLC